MMTFNDNPSDSPSIERFFQEEYDGLLRYALRVAENDQEIAMDAVSESFKTIIANYDRYRDYPHGRLFNYMMSMVHNKVLKEIDSRKRIYLSDAMEDVPDEEEDPIRSCIKSIDEGLLDHCISKLSPKQQIALKMYYFDDVSLDEVGRVLDMTAESARVTLWRIRKKLKRIYLKEESRWKTDEPEAAGSQSAK
ncbi:RNA polymerase sigma factor [Candidatus Allofournierella merdavium]|uniref:RNA polymerase sigma factor n=1 Tax=Candidatus Allofournierella merdavium TaxID=2838593 RepID=UPI00374F7F18